MPVKVKATRAGRGHGFSQVLEWSAYKHALLTKYLHVWCFKLGSIYRELAFVDTCAGAGKYDDGGDGSPLIAAKYNDHPTMLERPTRVTVHAFETDPDIYPRLVVSLEPFTSRAPPRAFVSNRSFFENPQPVLDATRGMPTLFFIDPYGTEEVTYDRLKHVITDTKRDSTELLVRIDPTMLARYAGWVRSQKRAGKPVRCADAYGRLLERLNVDSAGIAEDADSEPPSKWELLAQYLHMYTTRFRYVQVVHVRAVYDGAAKYAIVHATDSPDGAAHLNDAVSTIEDSLFATTYERAQGDQQSLFGTPPRPPRYSLTELDEQTVTLIQCMPESEFIEVRAELTRSFGPFFREKDHKAAVKRLMEAGRIETVGGVPKVERGTRLRVKRQRS